CFAANRNGSMPVAGFASTSVTSLAANGPNWPSSTITVICRPPVRFGSIVTSAHGSVGMDMQVDTGFGGSQESARRRREAPGGGEAEHDHCDQRFGYGRAGEAAGGSGVPPHNARRQRITIHRREREQQGHGAQLGR